MIDAIVPAHNEAPTVAAVARAILDSGVFRRVLVVDDGSTDETAREAENAGAEVLRLSPNRGKAEAMLAGIKTSDAEAFGFFDADLIGFRPEHARLLADHFALGFDQVCGLRDYGALNAMQAVTPVMTGERIVRRWIVDELPKTCWRGYAIESAINFLVDQNGGSTCLVPMPGVTIRNKTQKVGVVEGWIRHFRMARQMRDAHRSLRETNGQACKIG